MEVSAMHHELRADMFGQHLDKHYVSENFHMPYCRQSLAEQFACNGDGSQLRILIRHDKGQNLVCSADWVDTSSWQKGQCWEKGGLDQSLCYARIAT